MRRATHGIVLDFAEKTDPGLDPAKQENEDSAGSALTALGFVAVLCDGMGGHASGQQASATAVRAVLEFLDRGRAEDKAADTVREAIKTAGRAVHALGGTAPRDVRPGSTCVVVLLSDCGLLVGHVGDSRALLLRGQSVVHLTRDHSLVQQMLDAGVIGPEEALTHPDANRITRALGMNLDVDPELSPEWVTLQPGDVVVLASDGLTDVVEDRELLELCASHAQVSLATACDRLVELARDRGGPDNITVQLVGVVEAPRVHGTLRLEASGHAAATVPSLGGAAAGARIGVGPTVLDFAGGEINERTTLPGPSASPPMGIAPPPAPPVAASRSRRTAWPWLLVLGALGALGLGAYWWLGEKPEEETIPAPEPKPKAPAVASTTNAGDSEPCEAPGTESPAMSSAPGSRQAR